MQESESLYPDKSHPGESYPGEPLPGETAAINIGSGRSDLHRVESLIDQASDAIDQANSHRTNRHATDESSSPHVRSFELDNLTANTSAASPQSIDVLSEVELDLRIELGRTNMTLQEVLQLRSGSVVALDALAGDPVNVYVNNRIVARGEIVVMDNNFCVRVTELVGA